MEYVENITCSDDGQIICLTTKYAILLFETTKLAFVLKIDTFPLGLTGKICNSKILYNTRILGVVVSDKMPEQQQNKKELGTVQKRHSSKNLVEENQSLIIIDIEYNRILGQIKLKGKIDDFELTKTFIIIKKKSLNKVLLFKTSTLEYYTTIENVNLGKIRCNEDIIIQSFNSDNDSSQKIDDTDEKDNEKENNSKENQYCILAYQDYKDKQEVVLMEYMLDHSRTKILNQNRRTFIPNFSSVGVKFIYLLDSYLLVSSNIGNKLHIYDIHTFMLYNCIYLGDFPYDLSGIRLTSDKTILSIITNNKYVKLFKLAKINKRCMCSTHDDTKVTFTKHRSFFDSFKHKINSGKTEVLCKYKINQSEDDQLVNDSIVVFDENNNERMWVIQKNCTLKKFTFNPNKPNTIKLDKTIKLSEFYRYDMEAELKQ